MRPGGTQIKRGAAVRMRRRLGLAPRACALLSCSLVLVIAGVSAYGMTVPSMMQAHAAREPRVGHEVKSDLGTTTGYAWASVVAHIVFGTDDADGAEAPDNEVTLANGKTIVLTNTKIIDRLSNNSVAATVNKVEQQKEQEITLSVRPEEFLLDRDSTEGISAIVDDCVFLGLNTHYFVHLSSGEEVEIIQESSIDSIIEPGSEIKLKINTDKVNLFTADGEENILTGVCNDCAKA